MRSIERNPRYCIENRLRPEGSLEIALYYISFHIESIIAAPIQGADYFYIFPGVTFDATHLSHPRLPFFRHFVAHLHLKIFLLPLACFFYMISRLSFFRPLWLILH